MGGCRIPNDLKSKHLQTSYYKSPEMLLGLDYDTKSDMWSLGCTIYELLTGDILFDPDDFEGNFKRYHIYLMVQKLGMIPNSIINKSPKKDIFFTANGELIKGYKSIDTSSNLFLELEKVIIFNKVMTLIGVNFIDLMKKIFCYDSNERISVIDALAHPLFNTSFI